MSKSSPTASGFLPTSSAGSALWRCKGGEGGQWNSGALPRFGDISDLQTPCMVYIYICKYLYIYIMGLSENGEVPKIIQVMDDLCVLKLIESHGLRDPSFQGTTNDSKQMCRV